MKLNKQIAVVKNKPQAVLLSISSPNSRFNFDLFASLSTLLLINLLSMNFKKLFGLIAVLGLMTTYSLSAQSEPTGEMTFHQMWTQLPEDGERHTEVAFAVVACDAGDMVLLNIFNEIGDAKDIAMTFTFTDGEKSATVEFTKRSFGPGEMLVGECSTDSAAKFSVPEGLDPATMNVSVTYN